MTKALPWLKEWAPVGREVATIASLIAIPWILHQAQSSVDERLATQNTATEYVQLAVEILREEKKNNRELRNWAVRVIDTHALVKLTAEEKAELLERGLGGSFGSGFGPGFGPGFSRPRDSSATPGREVSAQ